MDPTPTTFFDARRTIAIRRASFSFGDYALSIGATVQVNRFREAARGPECDDDPERYRERVGKQVKHKPAEKLD